MLYALLVMATVGGASCSEDELSASDAEWADEVVLQVARVNDVMALEVLPGLVPDVASSTVVELDGTLRPEWAVLRSGCRSLQEVLPSVGELATDSPERFDGEAAELLELKDVLTEFALGCIAAVPREDVEALQALSPLLASAASTLQRIEDGLPASAHCPADVDDRPESCEP